MWGTSAGMAGPPQVRESVPGYLFALSTLALAAVIMRQTRSSMLETLSAAAATLPGDRWVAGHLVRYLAEAERFEVAMSAAERGALRRQAAGDDVVLVMLDHYAPLVRRFFAPRGGTEERQRVNAVSRPR